ncbi:protein-methionine-sulfoxide reductase catalytic subunit MsrP [Prosthecomicrobium sp. N25]|uniref:protein-methionine-sulfoxide reductase catalytic subunit MsrP n=1 Tax=Prosthecomicrobium sp. N25 TaxID=3129254 RepID=UPI0030778C98
MPVIRRKGWEIPESQATPEALFLDRRAMLGLLGAAGASGLLPAPALAQEDAFAKRFPAQRNEAFKLDRPLTPEDVNGNYNNFYEYGTEKGIASAAQKLKTKPWTVTIDGLVEKPIKLDFEELVAKMPIEERLYRHRCVEAWSMTIPWTGFPIAKLIEFAKPTSGAKYLRMETFLDKDMAFGQRRLFMYPWPYVEGLTMAEAANDLAFLAVGAYGKPIAKQHGAPIRLAVPWKYGFKSIKSIVRFEFTAERPKGMWEQLQSSEYGFWANVNPEVPHPRWSQSHERVLHTGDRVPTLLYNGYGEWVAGLYKDMKGENLFM